MGKKSIIGLLKLFGVSRKQLRRIRRFNGASKFSRFDEENIVQQMIATIELELQFFVDVGAGNGVTDSNTCLLAIRGWQGLSIESDPKKFSELADEYECFPGVSLSRCVVTPDNIVFLLQAHRVPETFSLLSLDIDGCDYFVLEQLLTRFRPLMLCVEINEKIPPPIKFSVKWDPNYVWKGDHFYGHSISQLGALASEHRYEIVWLEYNNVFLVSREVCRMPSMTPDEAYRKGYLTRPDRLKRFPWNADMESLHRMSPGDALSFLRRAFEKYEGKYICSL
ncbi:MAG: hypothetical protein WBW16_07045 [Bacteroidota bacterium]